MFKSAFNAISALFKVFLLKGFRNYGGLEDYV